MSGNPVNRVDSDILSSPILSISRDKCRLVLGEANLADFETTFGANRTITETLNQTIVAFPITRRNGNVLQVTGTDNRIWTFSGLLQGENAKNKKTLLKRIIESGLPISFELFLNDGIHKVLVRNLSFQIETSCHIEYTIELIEYVPEYLYQIGTNLQSAFPDFTGDVVDASQTADEPGKSPCSFHLVTYLSNSTPTKIKVSDLIQNTGSSSIWQGTEGLFSTMTTCYESLLDENGNPLTADEKEKLKKQYQRARTTLIEFFNGLTAKIIEFLEEVVYKFGTTDRYNWQSKCLAKYAAEYPEEYNKMMEDLFQKIFMSDCCSLYIPGSSLTSNNSVKIPLFETTSVAGTLCISKKLFEYLYKSIEVFKTLAYIEICAFKIQILGDCINWCDGKTTPVLPPVNPNPTVPGQPEAV